MPKVVMFKNSNDDYFRIDSDGNLVFEPADNLGKILIDANELVLFNRWVEDQIKQRINSSIDPY